MIEEAYEAADAMGRSDSNELRDELGDVLLQVVLNAQLAVDAGKFDITDVIEAINAKMLRRHPHVFGTSAEKSSRQKAEIRSNWEKIKSDEKLKKSNSKKLPAAIFSDHGSFPATTQALKIGKTANKIRFDWDGPRPVLEKLNSEVTELNEAFATFKKKPSANLIAEIGDVYFTLGQLCRHLDLDPETVALDGNRKFLDRFAKLESIAHTKKIDISKASQETLEKLWIAAKKS